MGQEQGGCANGKKIDGPDLAYGDWSEPHSDEFNATPRTGSTCTNGSVTKTCAGFGTIGNIDVVRDGLDYDNGTLTKFVADPDAVGASGQQADEITFPFDVSEQPDANRLCDEAKKQGNYVRDNTSAQTTGFPNATWSNATGIPSWPEPSSNNTVVCYEFTNLNNSHSLRWAVSGDTTLPAPYAGCKGPIKQGTLVVKNGGFTIKSGGTVALFQGVVVTRGPEALLDSQVGDAQLSGNNCLDGFINSTGPITISGSVTPSSSAVANDRPGFFGVQQWSWRELYQ